ncbi:MAG TPA: BamA/TamA family outer membrane protein, partial [Vicinamibacterales bacterium]|nr:BamA/TamA family outer membrane protein [Vicinamibacterales bacterium]
NRFERRLLEIEQAGGFNIQRGFFVTFGDIKSGSGIALGPAYGKLFDNGTTLVAKGTYSIRNFKLLQLAAHSAPLAGGRVLFSGRARWQDAPTLALFQLGQRSPNVRANYGETMTEVSGQMSLQPARFIRLGAGTAFERYETDSADVPVIADVAVTPIAFPGLGADPDYLHSFALAAIDSRAGPGYSRRGSLLQATLHDYRQRNEGPFSFQRVDGMAQQLIPILHGNWVIDLSVRASTTSADDGETVPFFLMPELGGGSDLRGFGNYRFRDRHSILFTAEYRWYVQEYVDMAIFYDAGKVASRRRDLDLDGLKSDVGIGIRFHSPRATALRLEVARGNEGLRLIFAFGAAVK